MSERNNRPHYFEEPGFRITPAMMAMVQWAGMGIVAGLVAYFTAIGTLDKRLSVLEERVEHLRQAVVAKSGRIDREAEQEILRLLHMLTEAK